MHVVFKESNALLNNCEECKGPSIDKDVSSREEKEEDTFESTEMQHQSQRNGYQRPS